MIREATTVEVAVLVMLTLGIGLAFYRVARGPSLPDRVIALDLMLALAIGIVADYTIITQQQLFLDVAIVLALISFLATVGFALYIEKGTFARKDRGNG
jgi:multicomponent Na+:H+ antiporter subunit F